jgi:hypothetical protein
MLIKGGCHCGATQFTVVKRPKTVTRCTCSFCSKRGVFWAYYDNEKDFALTTSRDRIATYQWGTYSIEHHHCAICGCSTWSRSPQWDLKKKQPVSGKFKVQVNAWLLEDFVLEAQPIQVVDGKNRW